jgi:hypothetical protein
VDTMGRMNSETKGDMPHSKRRERGTVLWLTRAQSMTLTVCKRRELGTVLWLTRAQSSYE